jgi:hypothetical protein
LRLPYEGNGVAWRLGLDAEYWLSKNVGVGLQFGSQALTTVGFCPGGCGTASANRFSLAPSFNLRGNSPTHFPTISLALGISRGHREASNYCEIDTGCQPWSIVADDWGPYGSLTVRGKGRRGRTRTPIAQSQAHFASRPSAHLCASHLAGDQRYSQGGARLGHASQQTTEIYLRVDPTEKLAAIESRLPPELWRRRFRPPDKLLELLRPARP